MGGSGFLGEHLPPAVTTIVRWLKDPLSSSSSSFPAGSAICKACVARGWSVVSLSRNGEPKGKGREPGTGWMDKVGVQPDSYSWSKDACDVRGGGKEREGVCPVLF